MSRERTGVSANAVVAELEAEVARLTGLIHDPFVAKRRAERIAVLEEAHEEAVAFLEDSGGCFCKYEDGCTCPAERIILRWRDKLQPRAALAAEPTEEPGCPCGIADPAHCSRCSTCRNIAATSCTEPTGGPKCEECGGSGVTYRWRAFTKRPPPCPSCTKEGEG